ncbi:MAG: hypothetical protein KDD62_11585 [Bdellovibrionales bacterium]|nr:hypothetical protein [Bdellovibrionales bacterium]
MTFFTKKVTLGFCSVLFFSVVGSASAAPNVEPGYQQAIKYPPTCEERAAENFNDFITYCMTHYFFPVQQLECLETAAIVYEDELAECKNRLEDLKQKAKELFPY